MTTCIVLLRGINVGGRNRLAMADFRGAVEAAGGSHVATLLASGQAVAEFPARRRSGTDPVDEVALAAAVGAALRERVGLSVAVTVRTAAQLARVVAANPYPHLLATPKQLHVVFLDATPDPDDVALVGTRHGNDEFAVGDRVLYLAFDGPSHDSPLLDALRLLNRGTGTARNWATVTKLHVLAQSRTA